MSEISAYEAFNQVDMRVGKVVRVEINEEAKKPAYKIWIDLGELGERTTSAQYTVLYKPEQLVGQSVVCVVNLGTRRIAGFKSEVLMLGVQQIEGAVVYLTTERDVTPGTKVF